MSNFPNALFLAIASVAFCAMPALARDARCKIFEGSRLAFDQICNFEPDEPAGSFILTNRLKAKPLFRGISIVTVSVVSPGRAEVRGLTADGINSRWGEARRSTSDRACWAGADFRICVY